MTNTKPQPWGSTPFKVYQTRAIDPKIQQAIKLNVLLQVELQDLDPDFTQGPTEIEAFIVNDDEPRILQVYKVTAADIKGNLLEVDIWEVKEGESYYSDAINGYYSEGVPHYTAEYHNNRLKKLMKTIK